jgi:hypothetical protein
MSTRPNTKIFLLRIFCSLLRPLLAGYEELDAVLHREQGSEERLEKGHPVDDGGAPWGAEDGEMEIHGPAQGRKNCTENPIYVFSKKELCGLSPNSYIHVCL